MTRRPLNKTLHVDRSSTGAYIELFIRDGGPVGRMNMFDKDRPMNAAELKKYGAAIEKAVKFLEAEEARIKEEN